MKKIIIILVIVLIFLTSCNNLDSDSCIEQGGRIVNTLSEKSCMENETNIGEVQGLRCPCICCVPQSE